mmetsp:Transcript_11607/g.41756  ORF Transcript_11607/g.41756 Transcript_11607/m.41756 type:complete len:223 (+) Transcript_11607:555-1223(+)|eukprot:31176-Pelagococcus_subviridis.AAC.32
MFADFASPWIKVFHFCAHSGTACPGPNGCDAAPTSTATSCNRSPIVSTSAPSSGSLSLNASLNAGKCVSFHIDFSVVICSAGCMSGCQYAPDGHTAPVTALRSSSSPTSPSTPTRAAAAAGMNVACIFASAVSDALACDGVRSRSCFHPCAGAKSSRRSANFDSIRSSSHGRKSASKHRGTRTPASFNAARTDGHARNPASTAADPTSLESFRGAVFAFVRA